MTAVLWREVLCALRSRHHCGPRDLERLRELAADHLDDLDDYDKFSQAAADLIDAIDAGKFSATDPSSVAYWSAVAERELELEWPWRGDDRDVNVKKAAALNKPEEAEGIIENADF